MKSPLFILGCPRSGTTFLSSLLKRTAYGRPFESQFIIKYFKKLKQYGDLNKYENFSKLVRNILSERANMQHKLEVDAYEMFSKMKEKSYPANINAICLRIASKVNKHVTSWGDKTPFYTLHVDILLKFFPKSKIIYITRDGRDVALSLMERSWGPNNIYSCAKFWKNYIKQKKILNELLNSEKFLEVKYEELLETPEQELGRVYEFLDETYSQEEIQELTKTTKRGNYNKWKKKMKEAELKIFENIAADTLKAEGYETTYNEENVRLDKVVYYEIHNKLKILFYLLKINIIDTIAIKFFNKEPFKLSTLASQWIIWINDYIIDIFLNKNILDRST